MWSRLSHKFSSTNKQKSSLFTCIISDNKLMFIKTKKTSQIPSHIPPAEIYRDVLRRVALIDSQNNYLSCLCLTLPLCPFQIYVTISINFHQFTSNYHLFGSWHKRLLMHPPIQKPPTGIIIHIITSIYLTNVYNNVTWHCVQINHFTSDIFESPTKPFSIQPFIYSQYQFGKHSLCTQRNVTRFSLN